MNGYGTCARTISGLIVCIPLHVCDAQKAYAMADRTFTVIRPNGTRGRAKLAPEHYGLFTAGTGDIVVRMV